MGISKYNDLFSMQHYNDVYTKTPKIVYVDANLYWYRSQTGNKDYMLANTSRSPSTIYQTFTDTIKDISTTLTHTKIIILVFDSVSYRPILKWATCVSRRINTTQNYLEFDIAHFLDNMSRLDIRYVVPETSKQLTDAILSCDSEESEGDTPLFIIYEATTDSDLFIYEHIRHMTNSDYWCSKKPKTITSEDMIREVERAKVAILSEDTDFLALYPYYKNCCVIKKESGVLVIRNYDIRYDNAIVKRFLKFNIHIYFHYTTLLFY